MAYVSFRDRERQWRGVGGSYARQPRQQPRKTKTPPRPAQPCGVVNSAGEHYDYDTMTRTLFINQNNPRGHLFPSRSKASGAVWRTIERWKGERLQWEGKELVLENGR